MTTDVGDIFAVWDTGAPGNILLKNAANQAGLDLEAYDKFQSEHFIINEHEFGPIRMNVWDFPAPEGLSAFLGYWFFSDKVVCIDFPNSRLLVRKH